MLLQGSADRTARDNLVLSLEMAEVVLKQRDLEGMQPESLAELWKVINMCCTCWTLLPLIDN